MAFLQVNASSSKNSFRFNPQKTYSQGDEGTWNNDVPTFSDSTCFNMKAYVKYDILTSFELFRYSESFLNSKRLKVEIWVEIFGLFEWLISFKYRKSTKFPDMGNIEKYLHI